MASRSEILKCVHEGKVEIVDDQYLDYAILEDDSVVISQSSFHLFIGLDTKEAQISFFPTPEDTSVVYKPKSSNDIEIGLPVIHLCGFCISLIELSAETNNKYKEIAQQLTILLMFLATIGLNQLISEEEQKEPEKNEPSFDEILAGLSKVPPKKK